ncbi:MULTISPECIES: DUF2388 domain-containing protein [unclassified Pseudomonas]|uniref:DUF2388 domain-containing protein n=1 Tax=unclassified Pseudomonas TaxID=196821 RepID=UPI002852EF71|nr:MULTISPECIES: DUF2388 domain-containing protein [unclassified Pseudomonas]
MGGTWCMVHAISRPNPKISSQLKQKNPYTARPSAGIAVSADPLLCYRVALRSQWKHQGMESWKTLAIVFMASISAGAVAFEVKNPVERTLTVTTMVPTMILGGTTAFTVYGPSMMIKAKDDALAFIGSEGEIRGAQFEQAVRYYHSAYSPPHMTDDQLALAIVTTF